MATVMIKNAILLVQINIVALIIVIMSNYSYAYLIFFLGLKNFGKDYDQLKCNAYR